MFKVKKQNKKHEDKSSTLTPETTVYWGPQSTVLVRFLSRSLTRKIPYVVLSADVSHTIVTAQTTSPSSTLIYSYLLDNSTWIFHRYFDFFLLKREFLILLPSKHVPSPVFYISINGISIHSIIFIKQLGIILEFLFVHSLSHV